MTGYDVAQWLVRNMDKMPDLVLIHEPDNKLAAAIKDVLLPHTRVKVVSYNDNIYNEMEKLYG